MGRRRERCNVGFDPSRWRTGVMHGAGLGRGLSRSGPRWPVVGSCATQLPPSLARPLQSGSSNYCVL
eukprot:1468376-Pyramimonas_sp.AAC.1